MATSLSRKACYLLLLLTLCHMTAVWAFEFGIGTHIANYKESSEFYIQKVKSYGFNSVRDELYWNDVEKQNGVFSIPPNRAKTDHYFQNLQSSNVSSLLVLDYGNNIHTRGGFPSNSQQIAQFASYAAWIADRYKGKVKYYEVWNEWYLGTGISSWFLKKAKPDDTIYFELIKATSEAIKRIDPSAKVIAGSFNPLKKTEVEWFDNYIDMGVLKYIDGISVHPYSYGNKNIKLRTPEGNISAIDRYEQYLKNKTGKNIDLYITEVGYPTNPSKGGVEPELAAQYMVKYTFLAKQRDYIKGIWWYTLMNSADNTSNRESNFGILMHNESEKPSAKCLKQNEQLIDGVLTNQKNASSSISCSGQ
ncbi:TPA: cellulase family glycosylhydrolase [Raoultella ornithinolytica]|uniref:cellulase family glycosylhydrolase n=1 Tax=Raoultella ornithinolytica TaxID=54291 RepID=UPI001D188B2C|nr:cellulase family glycosylhydrolase [Raoultella ornithinolytica]MEB7962092.1 cellulase family glycosylhydrolase [Raoultella ornithinolytica]